MHAHSSSSRRHTVLIALLCLVALVSVTVVSAGCSNGASSADKVPLPQRPAAPDLTTPESAVRAYLDWSALSYRLLNSDISSPTMTPDEGVRVDSYIELLKQQKQQGIDQHLTAYKVERVSTEGTRTLVATSETWWYRYFGLDGKTYVTPQYSTSYDSTYTVVRQKNGTWLVDKVDVKALGQVQ